MLTLELSSYLLEIANMVRLGLQQSVDSYSLFNTQSRVQQADLLMLENDEKATLYINMPH